jgi:hypothetical protein
MTLLNFIKESSAGLVLTIQLVAILLSAHCARSYMNVDLYHVVFYALALKRSTTLFRFN